MRPTFSVVIPARNEADSIAGAIASIGAQSLDLDRVEVVVVDGASDDETKEIAKRTMDRFGFRRAEVVENLERRTPSNLNRGLLWAAGDLLVRVDARSRIPSNYLEVVEEMLARPSVAVVGGRQVAVANDASVLARGIARALNNGLAMGWSRYRRAGAESGATDTVFLGAFRTDELNLAGGWNETFATNQDFELNRRMEQFGEVWFDARLPVAYLPRRSVRELFHQYHRFGRWKVAYWRRTGDRPQPRQLGLLVIPAVGAVAIGAATVVFGAKTLLVVAGASAAGLLAIDHVGGDSGEGADGTLPVRVVAATANAAVGLGWVSGVARALLGDDPLTIDRRR